jgi:hypothetical protein
LVWKPSGRPRRWEDNIKMDFRGKGCDGGWDWLRIMWAVILVILNLHALLSESISYNICVYITL